MAIGLLFDGPGVTQDQYYQVFNEVTDNGTRKVPGMLSHHAGPIDGGFCVIETWESQEALQDFVEQHLGKAIAAAGIETQPKIFEVVNTV
jgi:quinol monooxygenase YgiN